MNRFQKCVLGILTAASLTFAWRGQAQLTQPIPFTYDCQVRLTLTSGTPVTTADVTGASATSVYVTPVEGGYCGFYSGTSWAPIAATEQTVAVPATTSQMYDVFCYNSSSTMACDAALAWTSDSARATALTTQNGVLVKTGDTTRRYIGSFRTTTVSGQTEDSALKRFVYSYYHRVPRRLFSPADTSNWQYTTATWRQAHAVATNQVAVVIGWPETIVSLELKVLSQNSAAGTAIGASIGVDSTTVPSAYGCTASAPASIVNQMSCHLENAPAVGYHFYPWLEYSTAAGITTWYGTANVVASVSDSALGGWMVN